MPTDTVVQPPADGPASEAMRAIVEEMKAAALAMSHERNKWLNEAIASFVQLGVPLHAIEVVHDFTSSMDDQHVIHSRVTVRVQKR